MYDSQSADDVCSHRLSFFLDNFIRRVFQNPRRIVGPYISPGDKVVDLGCGPGFFSLEMAKLVGSRGRVYAADLQEQMLARVAEKARAANLAHVLFTHRCTQTDLGLDSGIGANFILAYYMVHETRDLDGFFSQAAACLAPYGKFLIVEPPFHVSEARFNQIALAAQNAGLSILERPRGKGGRSLLLSNH